MSDAQLVAIAKAVTISINEATLTEDAELVRYGITAKRSYAAWDDILKDLSVLHIDVVPADKETTLAARGNTAHQCGIDVAVRKKFDACDQDPDTGDIAIERMDELVKLTEEIGEIFIGKRLENHDNARWSAIRDTAPYSRRYLRDERQYSGVLRLTFVSHKQLPEL